MFDKDIFILYYYGINKKLNDDDIVQYDHYLAGHTLTTFKYVKLLYGFLLKGNNFKLIENNKYS